MVVDTSTTKNQKVSKRPSCPMCSKIKPISASKWPVAIHADLIQIEDVLARNQQLRLDDVLQGYKFVSPRVLLHQGNQYAQVTLSPLLWQAWKCGGLSVLSLSSELSECFIHVNDLAMGVYP